MQTLSDLRSSYVSEGPAQVETCGSRNWLQTWSTIYAYTRVSSWNPNSSTLEPDRPQHVRSASCVIAQQYSSPPFSNCAFIPTRKNSARVSVRLLFKFLIFLKKCVTWSSEIRVVCWGHVARMGDRRGAYRVLVGRPKGKRPLIRPRRRWDGNIKMDFQQVKRGHGIVGSGSG
jgi:hypothetical protein